MKKLFEDLRFISLDVSHSINDYKYIFNVLGPCKKWGFHTKGSFARRVFPNL